MCFERAQQRLAARRREAQAEARHGLGVQTAVQKVCFGRAPFRRVVELLHEKRRSFAMQLHQRGALLIFAALFGRALPRLRNGDAALFRHRAHRLGERDLVHLHHEFEHIAARAAPKAVINLLHRITANDGVFSEWNGHSPVKFCPDFFRRTYSPTTRTMSACCFTRSANEPASAMSY